MGAKEGPLADGEGLLGSRPYSPKELGHELAVVVAVAVGCFLHAGATGVQLEACGRKGGATSGRGGASWEPSLQPQGLGHELAVVVAVAVGCFLHAGATGVQLQVVLLGEADGSVALVG